MKEAIIILVPLLAVITTIFHSKGLWDSRREGIFKLTLKGRYLVLIHLLIIGLSIWQYFLNEHKLNIKEQENIQN
jgi:hypothetical protein